MRRLVIKIGSGILTNSRGMNGAFFNKLADEVVRLKKKGIEVILVSSGAIASGMALLKLHNKPTDLAKKQAVAAMGQPLLMNRYDKVFGRRGFRVAQILLTRGDFTDKTRHDNAQHALLELIRLKVIPIINENDSVAVDEIKVGDNDQLSSMVARLVGADTLVILTDIDGLYDQDPRKNKNANHIPVVEKINERIFKLAGDTHSHKSTGGMITKLKAAKEATSHGITTWIINGKRALTLSSLGTKKQAGTVFLPK